MEPIEALRLVLNAAALANMPKASHIQADQAGILLRDFIVEAMKPVKEVASGPVPVVASAGKGKPKE